MGLPRRKNIITWILVIILLIATFFLPTISKEIESFTNVESSGGKVIYSSHDLHLSTIEIADTLYKQQQGLMHRSALCAECAMLFVYNYPTSYDFWMKNTKFSLDIIFLDQNGKIINLHKFAKPLDTNKRYKAQSYYWYVLEVNAGFADKYKLKAGDIIDVQDLLLRSGVLSNNK